MSKYVLSVGRTVDGDKLDFSFNDLTQALNFVELSLDNDYVVVIIKAGTIAPAQKQEPEVKKAETAKKAFVKKKKPVTREEVEEMYRAGMNPVSIASEFGCRLATVQKIIDSLNNDGSGAPANE